MSQSVERVYDKSYWRCMRTRIRGGDFFETFYEQLFQKSPAIKAHFAGIDMRVQRKMLRDSFTLIGEHYFTNNQKELERLRDVHSGRDIPPDLYETWLDMLIASVREHDIQFSPEVEAAWRAVFSAGIGVMTSTPE